MGVTAAVAAVIGATAAVGSGVNAYKSGKDAKAEAEAEKKKQEKLRAEASREQAKQKEINAAENTRAEHKKDARRKRTVSGGGMLSGGDTGLMKSKLGE